MTQPTAIGETARQNEISDPNDFGTRLLKKIVGQTEAIDAIVPVVDLFQAGLSPANRPAGVFLLLGPTGTGKTRTVEALAEVLHGSERNILRIDCGEFQLEHEVAKLIGAPPGYLGHRETQPMINQQKLNAVASEQCGLSLVLFDEIEKAAPSMARLLLGVLDKGTLKLGDNTSVNFEHSLIFMTSNAGAREMMRSMRAGFGLEGLTGDGGAVSAGQMSRIGQRALQKRFSPEFLNRIDQVLTYRPLDRQDMEEILEQQLVMLRKHIDSRLGAQGFDVQLTSAAKAFLLDEGTSSEYGARELKRVIHRRLLHPIARMMQADQTEAGGCVWFDHQPNAGELARMVVCR